MGKKKKRHDITAPRVRPMKLVPPDHPALHGVALVGSGFDQSILELGERLVATAIKHNGLAVAAPQVGVGLRLVALRDGRLFLNPELSRLSGETAVGVEGCLSYPNRWFDVLRSVEAEVVGLDPRTNLMTTYKSTTPLEARMWQHEIDHLDGIVLVNRWPESKRSVEAQHLR